MLARDAVLKLSPLIAQKNLDLEINENPAKISGNAWLIGELIRNLQIWNAGEGLPKLGTKVLDNIINQGGLYPTNNFQFGTFKDTAEVCGEALELIAVCAEKGSVMAVSDAGVAASLCRSALEGASLNVFINTQPMKDREYAERLN